ncbi:aspartate--tRNA ligase, partial [Candidatus Saccharibacteria bacterium]
MERTMAAATPQSKNERVTVCGWVQSRRDHGGQAEAFATAETLRDEFVVRARGVVAERDEGLTNPNIDSGTIEIVVDELTILNRAETLPIQPFAEAQAGEELRLKYRYLDLRRPKMQRMLRRRAEMFRIIRDYVEGLDFTEVSTPILANSSPEGARDFLIPSRLHEDKFYALPQAPQQFKQLLMVGGVPRYYQLAACFRD